MLLLTMSLTFSFKILVYVNEVLKLDYNNPIFNIGESVNVAEGPLIFIVLVVLSMGKKR